MLLGGDALLNDGDTYWHIAVGGWIVSHGFPHTDPFSFTFAGKPWIAKEWLSQLLYFGAWRLAGWTGVVVLAAGAIALAFGLLARALRQDARADGHRSWPLPPRSCWSRPTRSPARTPSPCRSGGRLDGGPRPRRRPPRGAGVWLLAVMVAVGQPPRRLHLRHRSGRRLRARRGRLRRAGRATPAQRIVWVRFGVLALVAGCVTPYGPGSMLATVKVLGLGPALSLIGEWKPADFGHLGGLELVLLAGFGLALCRGITLPPVAHPDPPRPRPHGAVRRAERRTAGAARAAGRCRAARPPVPRLRGVGGRAGTSRPSDRAPIAAAALIAAGAAVGAGSLTHYRPADASRRPPPLDALSRRAQRASSTTTTSAATWSRAACRTFIDGRTELYGGAFIARYVARRHACRPRRTSSRSSTNFRIDATLLPPAAPAVALLDTLPGWQRLYADDIAVVHVRTPLAQ